MDFATLCQKVLDLAMHRQWQALIALALIGVTAGVRTLLPKIESIPKLKWLKTDRGGAITTLVLSEMGAVGTALGAGQHVTVNLIVAALVTGATAAGGYTIVKRLLWPADAVPAAAPDVAKAINVAAKLVLPFFIVTSFAGCGYCWQSQHVQEPKCVIAHDVVQCAEGDAIDAVAIAAAILGPLVNLGTVPTSVWDGIKQMAIKLGFKTGGCFWAKLQDYFNTPTAEMADMARAIMVGKMEAHFADFKAHFGAPQVKFCFKSKRTGQQVCR